MLSSFSELVNKDNYKLNVNKINKSIAIVFCFIFQDKSSIKSFFSEL